MFDWSPRVDSMAKSSAPNVGSLFSTLMVRDSLSPFVPLVLSQEKSSSGAWPTRHARCGREAAPRRRRAGPPRQPADAARARRRRSPGRRAILAAVPAPESHVSKLAVHTRTALGEPLIRFKGVKKSFGEKHVFSRLSLEIRRGETTTVMGASGSGKSVMLKMLIGLIRPDDGSITFDGDEITQMNGDQLHDLRRRIAYLFQGAALFDSLTVGENVAYGLREQFWNTMSDAEIQQRASHSLELVGLPGIESMRPADLSGGMKKRVGLARTLALQPEVILYDEPTTGLDPVNTGRINHLILGIQRALKITSIVVTHDMGTAFSVSDRLVMIHKGRVLLTGTKDEFRHTQNVYVKDFIEGHAPENEDVEALLLA